MPKELYSYAIFLFVFIFINVFIYFVLQLSGGEKLFRKLFYYWASVLLVFILEGYFVSGKLVLSLSFLINFLPISIVSNFLLNTYNYNFKTKFYLIAIPISIIFCLFFNFIDASFFICSIPIVLVCIGPLIEGLIVIMVLNKNVKKVTKYIACLLYCSGILSCIYYALFRFNATPMQFFIGFGSGFIIYIMSSILLPIVCIQMINDKKNEYLESVILERTKELIDSKQNKENLLRVLVHDISNPLQSAMFQVALAKKIFLTDSKEIQLLGKVSNNLISIKDIINHVKEYECILSGKRTSFFSDVYLSDCLNEVEDIFSERFREKNIRLIINNSLSDNLKIRVDKTPFIHCVASNLVSNSLKFSKPGSTVIINAHVLESNIVIEVVDQGIGMSKDKMENLFDIGNAISRVGTLGETGTGFGMHIVKAYTTIFGGRIEANSSQVDNESGTTISLYLPTINQNENSKNQTFIQ